MKFKIFLAALTFGLIGCAPAPTSKPPIAIIVYEYDIRISGYIKVSESQYLFTYEGEKSQEVDVIIDKEKVKVQTQDKKEMSFNDLVDTQKVVGCFISQIRIQDIDGANPYYFYSFDGHKIGDLGIIEVTL